MSIKKISWGICFISLLLLALTWGKSILATKILIAIFPVSFGSSLWLTLKKGSKGEKAISIVIGTLISLYGISCAIWGF